MVINLISFFLLISAIIVGFIFPLINPKSKSKIWASFVVLLVIVYAITKGISLTEKRIQITEDLKKKYTYLLNDTSILKEIRASVENYNIPLDNLPAIINISYFSIVYNSIGALKIIGIYSPQGKIAKYKVVDLSEYNNQGIIPLIPINYHDSVFYIGGLLVHEDKLDKKTKINLITKFNNGFIKVERIKLENNIFDIHAFSPFFPLILTNIERLLLVQEAALLSNLPEITFYNDSTGKMKFGYHDNRTKLLPYGTLTLLNNGGVAATFTNVPEANVKLFHQKLNEKINQAPSISIKEIADKQINIRRSIQ
jgi:hypothetical protein